MTTKTGIAVGGAANETVVLETLVDGTETATVNAMLNVNRNGVLVRVAPGEEGRLIGRQGRVIQAIRTLVRAAGDPRERVNVDLDAPRKGPPTTEEKNFFANLKERFKAPAPGGAGAARPAAAPGASPGLSPPAPGSPRVGR